MANNSRSIPAESRNPRRSFLVGGVVDDCGLDVIIFGMADFDKEFKKVWATMDRAAEERRRERAEDDARLKQWSAEFKEQIKEISR
ncbi:MAG: hypothetical protein ACR2QC_03465, partial [Gammaproteobacteria bacterium]